VTETIPPPGYSIANPARQTVTLGAGNLEVALDFRNDPVPIPGSLTVVKWLRTESGDMRPLAGATFALFRPTESGTKLDERTLAGSEHTWTDLVPGEYTVVEVAGPARPDGATYELADPITVTVPAGQNVRVEFYNELPRTGDEQSLRLVSALLSIGLGLAVRRPKAGLVLQPRR
jgi:uncharacterized surface anchored protein